jgi:hypothetical protein
MPGPEFLPVGDYPTSWGTRFTPMWGWDLGGFWTVNEIEARFYYEGTVDVISPYYDEDYINTYINLSSQLTGIKSLIVLEHEKLKVTSNSHSLLPFDSDLYYIKFASPNNELARPYLSKLVVGEEKLNTEFVKGLIDKSALVYQSLKELGALFPSVEVANSFCVDSKEVYLDLPKDFKLDCRTAINKYTNDLAFKKVPDTVQVNIEEIQAYARLKWQLLTI